MEKPFPGKGFGCTDSGPPEIHTEYQLSRMADMLYSAQLAGLSHPQITDLWVAVPNSLKMEFNWARWKYVPA